MVDISHSNTTIINYVCMTGENESSNKRKGRVGEREGEREKGNDREEGVRERA